MRTLKQLPKNENGRFIKIKWIGKLTIKKMEETISISRLIRRLYGFDILYPFSLDTDSPDVSFESLPTIL
jgi:hypothetical protein